MSNLQKDPINVDIREQLHVLEHTKDTLTFKKSENKCENKCENKDDIIDPLKIRHFSKRKISDYKTYKNITKTGIHAKGVTLLTNKKETDYIIQKVYDKPHENIYYNEVYWLLTLQKTGYFPKIIRLDPKNLTFWMTFCGETLSETEFVKYEKDIKKIEIDLYENYNCFHNDIKPSNVCWNKKRIYLIDCGWMDNKVVLPGYTKDRYGYLFPECFSDMKEKCLDLLSKKKDIYS